MKFARRVEQIQPSATVAVGNKASMLKQKGIDIIDLSVGEPDFKTPENIVKVAKKSLDSGDHGYTSSKGILELRGSISKYFSSKCELEYGPEEIIVTPGAKQALFEAIMTIIQEGDEAIVLTPAWVSYEPIISMAGGEITRVDLEPYEFQLGPAISELKETISSKTKLIVINSPSNPTGAVYSRQALEGVRDLAVDNDVMVISDEIYKEITYAPEYTSMGAIEGMGDRTVTVNGFSKAYAMTGWRLGYMGAPQGLIKQAAKIHSHTVTCATNMVQRAGIEALENTEDAVREMVSSFRQRRDFILQLLSDNGVDILSPNGAFYVMIPVDGNGVEWCEKSIEEAHVAMVPGEAFGAPGYARISYANSMENIEDAIERLCANGLI
ncbi:MAG: pyridoxal phosphate-dependent aminotransferase [Halobacteriales archaeon]|nr:pyridoxal phosphate-dependent aminotransferase [Halobacteriales archaeon]